MRTQGTEANQVPRTETKAITTYSLKDLSSLMPKSLHPGLRSSKYYTANNDSLTFQAQTHRSRTANTDENRRKLMDEVTRIYSESVPAETSSEKKKKHGEM